MRLSLRVKLALVSLLLLLFPLLGMRLITTLKQSLMISQEDTLTFTAQAVAAALADRADLFAREQFHALNQERDLYLFRLSNAIRLDGATDDWQPEFSQAEEFAGEHLLTPEQDYDPQTLHFRYLAGKQGRYLYVLFDVTDDHLIYRAGNSLRLDRSDHLQIVVEDENGRRRYIVTAHGPGWVNGFLLPENPVKFPVIEQRIQGIWQQNAHGYTLELRMPESMIGSRLAFAIADVDDAKTRLVHTVIGTADLAQDKAPGRLLSTSKAIEGILQSLDRPNARIRIVDRNQRVRAQVGSLRAVSEHDETGNRLTAGIMDGLHIFLQPLYRFFTTSFSADIQDPASQPTELDLQGIREGLAGRSSSAYR